MPHRFAVDRATQIVLQGCLSEVKGFLAEPRYLVDALLPSEQVTAINRTCFSVAMRPIQALSLTIQPIVNLNFTIDDSDATVQIEAVRCCIDGNPWIDRHFNLDFSGTLAPIPSSRPSPPSVTLVGKAHLQVALELPPLLRFTPTPLIQSIGIAITQGVLSTIQQSLCEQLPSAFQSWKMAQAALTSPASPSLTSLSS